VPGGAVGVDGIVMALSKSAWVPQGSTTVRVLSHTTRATRQIRREQTEATRRHGLISATKARESH
jgi:hypothetical protein